MKPKSEGGKMKTLDDVIKEMNEQCEIHENHLSTDNIEIYMRLACEAMAKEIVPGEWEMPKHPTEYDEAFIKFSNAFRAELLNDIARFMGDKK